MASQGKHLYEFGPFQIDTVERLLFRGDEMIPLTPKAIETLLALVSNVGRVLEKDDLIKMVWPDSFVEEGGLARNISLLRRVLGEFNSDVQFIETIPKRGYRFIAPLKGAPVTVETVFAGNTAVENTLIGRPESIPAAAPPSAPKRSSRSYVAPVILVVLVACLAGYMYSTRQAMVAPSRIHSLLVIPLSSPSNDPKQEFFTDAMTDELINSLAKIEALRVISRTSAMTYKKVNKALPQIARELNVDGVVEGSVVQADGRIRITIQLFDARSEKQLWARSYERNLRDVLTLQSELASSIAEEIQVKLTPGEKQRLASSRTVDPEAYLDYSYGRYYWNNRTPDGFEKAIAYFKKAIAKDPTYAPPYAGLADVLSLLGSTGVDAAPPREVMPQSKAAAMQAVRLDDTLAEGHASLGYANLSYDWDLNAAEREFKRAIELNPGYPTAHHWYAHYFLARAQPENAMAEMKRARALDPFSVPINMGVGWAFYHAKHYDEAIEQYRATLAMNPLFSIAQCALGMAYEAEESYPKAIREFKHALELPGSRAFAQFGLGRAYGMSGNQVEARQIIGELKKASLKQYIPAVYLSAVYASVGDKDQSIAYIQKAYEDRADYLIYLKTEPFADSLRSDARFQDLLKRIQP